MASITLRIGAGGVDIGTWGGRVKDKKGESKLKKIPSLFKRDYDGNRQVINEVTPGAEWVIEGDGIATRKWDGTSCLVRDGRLYKRYDAKEGRTPAADFEPAQTEPDPNTGHWPGWVPVGGGKEDRYHVEAWDEYHKVYWGAPVDGTYELIGPKVQSNPEGLSAHMLVRHGEEELPDCPRSFDGLKKYLAENDIEGIVWHHPDGRMVKIKAKDFGIKRGG